MRRKTRIVQIGSIAIGGDNPIYIQSMTNTKTSDIESTLKQIEQLKKAGCDIIRLAVLNEDDAYALKEICARANANLVADIHFDYKLALICLNSGINKLRINPGNIGSVEGIKQIVERCKLLNVPIRIGVNSGSINKDIEKQYGTSAKALVQSAIEHIKILEDLDFHNIVVSIKASSVIKTIEAYELFSSLYDYPVHLGVTEAGTTYSGSIKSSIALGHLLLKGIGDTIRVSLTDDPVKEVYAAKEILSSLDMLDIPTLVSCPTCGRCQYDMLPIANEINDFLKTITPNKKIKVAVMGCVVNGPGEAKDSNIGIAGGKNCAVLFKNGVTLYRIEEKDIINYLKNEIVIFNEDLTYKFYSELNDQIIDLRTTIFIKEQGFVDEIDNIDLEKKATYVVVYKNDIPIATGRFFEDNYEGEMYYHVGRLCVDKHYRNQRIGSIVLMLIENKIKNSNLLLSSQYDKVQFYKKNNYCEVGELYLEEGYKHQLMKKTRV